MLEKSFFPLYTKKDSEICNPYVEILYCVSYWTRRPVTPLKASPRFFFFFFFHVGAKRPLLQKWYESSGVNKVSL